jgi:hypothetical protein
MYAQLDLEVNCRRPKRKGKTMRAPLLAGVRAPIQTCLPPAGVRALPTWMRAPRRRARPPPRRCACPTPQGCAPSPHRCAPPADVRAPLLAGVCALPRRRARPPQACAPSPPPCVPPRRCVRPACRRAHPAPPMYAPSSVVAEQDI